MGDMYTNPPQSRNEAILRATIDGTEYTDPPQSRMEDLLIELKEAIEEGGGSVESYEQLTNKPQINGTTLSGDKSTEDLIPIDKGLEFDSDGKLAVSLGDGLAFNSDGEIDNLTEANPSDSATGELSKLKVGSDIYSVVTKAVNDLTNYYTKSDVYTKAEVNNIAQARFAVVAQLPTQDIQTNVIYLVPKSTAQTNNDYDEYIYALKSTNPDTYGWEKIGDTEIDLSDYVTKQALNTALADYTTTTDLTTLLAGKEPTISVTANRALVSDANGKVSASSATSEEVGYLSGVTGAIQTQINGKADTLSFNPTTRELSLKSGNTVLSTVKITTAKIVPFATGTDEEIKNMLDAYYNDEITWEQMGWQVGDTRVIHLDAMQAPNPNSGNTWSAQDITVVIVAHNHTDLETPINGHTKACITVQTRETLSGTSEGIRGTIYANGDASYDMTFTKWADLYMRTYLNDKVWGAFPSTFKASIKPSTHYRHTTYNGTESEQVTDNLFLPSYPEIFGTASYNLYVATNPVEGTQFEYYTTSTKRVKYTNENGVASGSADVWWEGSTSSYYGSSDGYIWCAVGGDGSSNVANGSFAQSLAPAFAM